MTPIEEYINNCPEDVRARMSEIRALVLEAAPEWQEKISYKMPTFYLGKTNMLHYAPYKAHIGIYPGFAALRHFAGQLKGYKTSVGAFQIPHKSELPRELLVEMIRWAKVNPQE